MKRPTVVIAHEMGHGRRRERAPRITAAEMPSLTGLGVLKAL